jgi:hypothetical protein
MNGRIKRQERTSRKHERFKQGLAAIQKRREQGIPTEHEEKSGSRFWRA